MGFSLLRDFPRYILCYLMACLFDLCITVIMWAYMHAFLSRGYVENELNIIGIMFYFPTHTTFLSNFWNSLSHPPTSSSLLLTTRDIGPSLIIWQIWSKLNQHIFQDRRNKFMQVWLKIKRMIKDTIKENFHMDDSLNSSCLQLVNFLELSLSPSSHDGPRTMIQTSKKVSRFLK